MIEKQESFQLETGNLGFFFIPLNEQSHRLNPKVFMNIYDFEKKRGLQIDRSIAINDITN